MRVYTHAELTAAAEAAEMRLVGQILAEVGLGNRLEGGYVVQLPDDAYSNDPDCSYCYIHRAWEDGAIGAFATCSECGHVYADPYGISDLAIELPQSCELCGHDL